MAKEGGTRPRLVARCSGRTAKKGGTRPRLVVCTMLRHASHRENARFTVPPPRVPWVVARLQRRQMTRKANRGVRVKDVFRVKRHVCEIPLEAYQRSGVAERETDYVTDEQIEQVSNIYDAMSVMDDAKTQFGNMPDGTSGDRTDKW